MSNTRQLLQENSLEDVFTVVYMVVDDGCISEMEDGKLGHGKVGKEGQSGI